MWLPFNFSYPEFFTYDMFYVNHIIKMSKLILEIFLDEISVYGNFDAFTYVFLSTNIYYIESNF